MYPIAKASFEKLHPAISWILKFSAFNTVQLFFLLIAQKIFGMTGTDYSFAAGPILLGNLVFLSLIHI